MSRRRHRRLRRDVDVAKPLLLLRLPLLGAPAPVTAASEDESQRVRSRLKQFRLPPPTCCTCGAGSQNGLCRGRRPLRQLPPNLQRERRLRLRLNRRPLG